MRIFILTKKGITRNIEFYGESKGIVTERKSQEFSLKHSFSVPYIYLLVVGGKLFRNKNVFGFEFDM